MHTRYSARKSPLKFEPEIEKVARQNRVQQRMAQRVNLNQNTNPEDEPLIYAADNNPPPVTPPPMPAQGNQSNTRPRTNPRVRRTPQNEDDDYISIHSMHTDEDAESYQQNGNENVWVENEDGDDGYEAGNGGGADQDQEQEQEAPHQLVVNRRVVRRGGLQNRRYREEEQPEIVVNRNI